MPRKPRKQLVGPGEDIERAAREQEYVELETELHTGWQGGQHESMLGGNPLNDDE